MNIREWLDRIRRYTLPAVPIIMAGVLVISACAPVQYEPPAAELPGAATTGDTLLSDANTRMQDMLGASVLDMNGNAIGEIDDFMVDMSSGDVLYTVVSFTEMPDRRIPVPFQYLRLEADHGILQIANEPMSVVRGAPAMGELPLPEAVEDPVWDRQVSVYWRNAGFPPAGVVRSRQRWYEPLPYYRYGTGIRLFPGAIVTHSGFTGQAIEGQDGSPIGQVWDLVFHRVSGDIAYVTVVLGEELLGGAVVDGNIALMLLGAFTWNTANRTLSTNVDQSAFLDAERYMSYEAADITDPEWNTNLMQYWGESDGLALSLRAGMRILPGATIRATDMLDYEVTNLDGQSLGTVEDVIYSPEDGRLVYAVLELGDFLGIGGQYNVVPVNSLTLDRVANLAFLDVSPDTLEESPTLPQDMMEQEIAQRRWDEEFRSYWQEWMMPEGETVEETEFAPPAEGVLPHHSAVTTLIGATVENVDGETLGEVVDVMLNVEEAQAEYAVLSLGGFLGLGDELYAIPTELVTPDVEAGNQRVLFNVEPEWIEEMPGFDQGDWPDVSNPLWDSLVRDFWDERLES